MGKYLDEMKRMTVDPACHRLGEIADELSERLDRVERCCCEHSDLRPAPIASEPPPPTP